MTRYDFVRELEDALRGNVDDSVVRENVEYYNNYINEKIASGFTEDEVLGELGSPRLIAKTIIDTHETAKTYGFESQDDTVEDKWSFSWISNKIGENVIAKIIAAIAVLFVIFLILSLFFKLVAFLFKPAVVVLACVAVYYLVKNQFKK